MLHVQVFSSPTPPPPKKNTLRERKKNIVWPIWVNTKGCAEATPGPDGDHPKAVAFLFFKAKGPLRVLAVAEKK